MKLSSLRKIVGWVGIYTLWTVLTLITVLPIYWMFVVSARSRVELFDRPTLLIKSFYIQNYLNPLSSPAFQRYLMNSVIVSTSNAILVAILALLATYALSRWKLGGADNIFFWTITQRMAPPAAFVLPLFSALHPGLQVRRLGYVRHPHWSHPALLRLQSALRSLVDEGHHGRHPHRIG